MMEQETGNVVSREGEALRAPRVIVMDRKRKKKKKKYSRRNRSSQEFEVATTKSTRQITRAVDRGISEWTRLRRKSSRKKKDGAVKDSSRNARKALSKAVRIAGKAPKKFLDELESTRLYKRPKKRLI